MSGFSWMMYGSDDGRTYALKVDDDLVADSARGWSTYATNEDPQYPRGWRPRAAIGVDAGGRVRWAICASLDAPLWAGTDNLFHYRDTNGTIVPAIVIGRRDERTIPIHGPGAGGMAAGLVDALRSVVDPR